MTPEEFNEAFSLCQFLPGPNVVNLSIVFGARVGGANGALAALAGVVGPPIAIVLGLAALYAHFGSLAATQRALAGLAAAAGLIIAVAAKMATPLFRRPAGLTPLVTIGVFAAVGLFRFSLLWVVLAATPLSILAVWWWRR